MPSSLCSLYGLVCSVDFAWSWCPKAEGVSPDVSIAMGSLRHFANISDAEYRLHGSRPGREPSAPPIMAVERGADGHLRVSYADGARFVISADLCEVYGVARSDLTLDDLLVYLQGPILGLLLRLRGVTCLHASAVAVDGKAIAIVGQGGMGKSTSAATFAQMGLPVFTDDVLALRHSSEEGFAVQPGLPRVLLWPESTEALFGAADALPRIVSTWPKRYLDLTQLPYRFAERPASLAAVYLLGERLEPEAPTDIAPIEGTSALIRLVANTYGNDFLDPTMRAAELKVLGQLMEQVPIRQVRAPNDRKALSAICEAIVADARKLRSR